VATGLIGDARWVIGFHEGAEDDPDDYGQTTAIITAAGVGGPEGGGGGTLEPVGTLMALRAQIGCGEVTGSFVYGVAPPGTATVEITRPDGSGVPVQLLDTEPRDQGERWFGTFDPNLSGVVTVVARPGGRRGAGPPPALLTADADRPVRCPAPSAPPLTLGPCGSRPRWTTRCGRQRSWRRRPVGR
jgi:hypothetical protein